MASVPKRFCTVSLGGSVAALIAPTGAKNVIQAANLTNTSALPVTVTLYLPAGGAAGATNLTLPQKSLAPAGSPGCTYEVEEILGQTIEDGASLQGSASVAGVVTLICSGLEVTAA